MFVYKILRQNEFLKLELLKKSFVTASDYKDGYIHLSKVEQLEQTLKRHFPGEKSLILVAIESASLIPDLKWEESKNNEVFPHYYGELNFKMAYWIAPIELIDQEYLLPAGI